MLFQRYKRKFRIIFSLLIFLFLVGGGYIAAYLVRYSATSELVCRQCHPEISELWRKSNGHPSGQTKCYECHSRGYKFMPKSWNLLKHTRDQLVPPEYLADDKLTSQRCLDCHKDILNLGYKVKKRIIKFNHRFHHGEGLDCVDCHRTSGHEYMTEGTNRPTVMECLMCHLREFEGPPKSQKCLNCHDIILAPGRSLR